MSDATELGDDEECPDNCQDKVPLNGYYHCPVCDREWFPEEEDTEGKQEPEFP